MATRTGALYTEVKRQERDASHSPPSSSKINPLNAELNPICHLMALLGAHHILHVSWVRVRMSGTTSHSSYMSSGQKGFTFLPLR